MMFARSASPIGNTMSALAFGKRAIKLEVIPAGLNGHTQEFEDQAASIFAKTYEIKPDAGDTVEFRATQAGGDLKGSLRINGKPFLLSEGYNNSLPRLVGHALQITMGELRA